MIRKTLVKYIRGLFYNVPFLINRRNSLYPPTKAGHVIINLIRLEAFAPTAPVISSTPQWRFSRLADAPPPLPLLLRSSFCNRMQLDACAKCATRCKYHCATDSVWTGLKPKISTTKKHTRTLAVQTYKESANKISPSLQGSVKDPHDVFFEKVPTYRNTAAERMTSKAHDCPLTQTFSFQNSHNSNPSPDTAHATTPNVRVLP